MPLGNASPIFKLTPRTFKYLKFLWRDNKNTISQPVATILTLTGKRTQGETTLLLTRKHCAGQVDNRGL